MDLSILTLVIATTWCALTLTLTGAALSLAERSERARRARRRVR
jgi:hypothetical protein